MSSMTQQGAQYNPTSAPTDLKFFVYEKRDHIAYLTINRPEVLNALNAYCYSEMRRCWNDVARDPDIYVAVVTGAGDRAFCGGLDVKFLADHQAKGVPTPSADPNSEHYLADGRTPLPGDVGLDKPVIAAINGLAVGVGLGLVLQCQLRVMSDDAWLGDQHTNIGRLGNPTRIYAELPHATAAYLTLCNGRLSAAECLSQGIVNRVVPRADVISQAEELARMVCGSAPRAVQAAVRLYRLAKADPVLGDYSLHLNQEIAAGPDATEGPRAFKERRTPAWSGQ